MKKSILLFLLLSALPFISFGAEETTSKIRLQIETSSEEITPLGLPVNTIESAILAKLQESDIVVQNEGMKPLLLVRLKTIPGETQIVSFIQLAFFEQAHLDRNRQEVWAMTWSQASLVSSKKEEFSRAILDSLQNMTSAFTVEYQKAFPKEVKTEK
jgi:hypothetical protein